MSSPSYSKVQNEDPDVEDNKSETDDGLADSLSKNEKKPQHHCWKAFGAGYRSHRVLWGICILLCILNVVLVWRLYSSSSSPKERQILGEVNGLVPEFPQERVVFQRHAGYGPDNSSHPSLEEASRKWISLMPRGNGFIDIQDPDKYDLPPPIRMHGKKLYAVAVFHQLHCLHTIMRNYNMLLSGEIMRREDMDGNAFWHAYHCFDYLRQSLLCCGDTALEGQSNVTRLPGTDGMGGTHMCKRYGDIVEWAEKRRVSNVRHI